MARGYRLLLVAVPLLVAGQAFACEPVVPFMQAVAPAMAFSGSVLVLAMAVAVKSILFTFFERRLPRLRAAWRMFLGNVLTSFVGLLVAVMIASSADILAVGVPLVFFLCWLPSRRLVKTAPLPWLRRLHPVFLAVILTFAFLASCILFGLGRYATYADRLALYWIIKLVAIFLALFASVTLTTVWEEWVIWRLSSRLEGAFFASVLRTNLYVLVLVMAVPAALILPKRLKSPDFLAGRASAVVGQATASSR